MKITVKRLTDTAKLPKYAHDGDAGMDIFADETVTIKAGTTAQIKTGIAVEFESGYVALCWDKSGLAINHGLKIMGGVIDSGYRGEYIVSLHNLSEKDYTINQGEKVTQILLQRVESAIIVESDSLSESARGHNKFGSTGKV